MINFPDTYKTAVLNQGIVTLEEKDFPKNALTDNSLVIKIEFIGICRADVKEVIGSRDIPGDRGPLFGHEQVGRVVFAGKETGFELNERVTFNPNITPNRTTGFAEYFFITGSKDELTKAVIKIPDDITLDPPWSIEPFSATIRSLDMFIKLSEMDLRDKTIAFIGAGVAGTMIALYAKYYGAKVKLFNRGQMRLDFLQDQGIFTPEELSKLEEMANFKDTYDVVYVVPTKIDQDVLHLAFNAVKPQGFIHLYGGTRASDKFLDTDVDIDLIRRNETKQQLNYQGKVLTVTGAYGQTKEDYEKGFELYRNHHDAFPLEKLVSKYIKLDELPENIMGMAKDTLDFPGKVLVKND